MKLLTVIFLLGKLGLTQDSEENTAEQTVWVPSCFDESDLFGR